MELLPAARPSQGPKSGDLYSNTTLFYGSSCANIGKGALSTPETLPLFSPCVKFPTFFHCSPLSQETCIYELLGLMFERAHQLGF
eukprot:4023121-Pyramimonas_sp.AAC.1